MEKNSLNFFIFFYFQTPTYERIVLGWNTFQAFFVKPSNSVSAVLVYSSEIICLTQEILELKLLCKEQPLSFRTFHRMAKYPWSFCEMNVTKYSNYDHKLF